ncbi:MAG TPA: LysR substrate-binding domain-containing protein [Dongiaceae bacterium]|nr:LysR substrate-binding domain-containing protein [Dongiaceae bacterium]
METLSDSFSLLDLELFVRAAQAGNLSQAARELSLQPATASASLKRLEQKLAARLMVRSTRSLRLTPAGEAFLTRARQALETLREARDGIHGSHGELRGNLRIAAPSDFGRNILRGWLDAFQDQHPQLDVMLMLSDRLTDFYRESVDFALRYGVPSDSALIVKPLLTRVRRVLVASPTYLREHGTPQTPQALADHAALAWVNRRSAAETQVHDLWSFTRGDETQQVSVRVRRACDDGAVVHDWAVAGFGIAYKAELDVKADIAAGRLVQLLPEWEGDLLPLNLVMAFREYQPPAVRLALQFLTERAAALA